MYEKNTITGKFIDDVAHLMDFVTQSDIGAPEMEKRVIVNGQDVGTLNIHTIAIRQYRAAINQVAVSLEKISDGKHDFTLPKIAEDYQPPFCFLLYYHWLYAFLAGCFCLAVMCIDICPSSDWIGAGISAVFGLGFMCRSLYLIASGRSL